jgi:hypothetical protein
MNKKSITLEEIFPLTIVRMKHGKYAIVEGLAVYKCVQSLQENEDVQYDPDKFMKESWGHINYGIGNSVNEALERFKINLK